MVVALCHAQPDPRAEPFQGVLGPVEGVYGMAQVLLPATLAAGPATQFRFKGQDSWFPFDRPLYLGAFPGEERTYAIEFKAADGTRQAILTYTIDRRPPEAPQFTQASGDVGSSFNLGVKGEGQIFLSLDGSPFELFTDAQSSSFAALPDATRLVRAVAYCVDPRGNASRTVSGQWRLHPEDIQPSFSLPGEVQALGIRVLEDGSDIRIEQRTLLDSSRLTLSVPLGATPCIAVNASKPFSSMASYAQLAEDKASASCIIPFPWGYEQELSVQYGYAKDGMLFVAPEPLKINPVFPIEEGSAAPATALAPNVRLDDTSAYIDWPASPWRMLFDSGDGIFTIVSRPLVFRLGTEPMTIRYASQGLNGSRSLVASLTLPARRIMAEPALSGVEDGGRYGSSVTVFALAQAHDKAALLYEFTEGDGAPPTIHRGSLRIGQEGLRFDGRDGETIRYRLRVVAVNASSMGDVGDEGYRERFYSFTIDRQAPDVPQTGSGVAGYSSSDALISFKPQDGSVFVSVSETAEGEFVRYDGPISVGGSKEGRKRYTIRAYAEDEFGNRSAQMQPVSILVDISSMYVDASGRVGAVGGPDDPMPYLDDAIEAAQATGKRFIYVRGMVRLRRAVTVYGSLTVTGGFDDAWNESPTGSSHIYVEQLPSGTPYAIRVHDGTLNLSSMTISMMGDGSGGLIESEQGELRLNRITMHLSGGIEKTAIKATGGMLSLLSSSLVFSKTLTGRGMDAAGASLALADSTLSCDASVRLLDVIRLSDADARISGLRLDASPAQALSILSATRASLSIERSILSVRGGSSSCRVFSASASDLSVDSVYVDVSWQGSVEVFNASSASGLRVAHLSAFVESPRSVFVASSGSGIDIVNSIAVFMGGDALFIRSDTELKTSSIASNCLWGFSRLMEGRDTLGALSESTLQRLNDLASDARPNMTEAPSKTFYASAKGLRRLSEGSACVDSGVPVIWASKLDLFGKTRSKDSPDIGAEEH
jgi:hypothetical protein